MSYKESDVRILYKGKSTRQNQDMNRRQELYSNNDFPRECYTIKDGYFKIPQCQPINPYLSIQ